MGKESDQYKAKDNQFTTGCDETKIGGDFETFGITDGTWVNRIEVHGSADLRDYIVNLLNANPPADGWLNFKS